MEDIIRSIKSTPSAHSTLRVKFKANSWIDIISECSEEELVLCGMEKIRQDISNYSAFIKMLQDTQGLDTLVSIIEERMRGYGESASFSIEMSRIMPFLYTGGGGGSSPFTGEL